MSNLNYTLITLGVKSWRENISGGRRTKKVEYWCKAHKHAVLKSQLLCFIYSIQERGHVWNKIKRNIMYLCMYVCMSWRKREGVKMQQKSWTGRRRSNKTVTCQEGKTGCFLLRLFSDWPRSKSFEKFRLRPNKRLLFPNSDRSARNTQSGHGLHSQVCCYLYTVRFVQLSVSLELQTDKIETAY
jgi:hypothetical protein